MRLIWNLREAKLSMSPINTPLPSGNLHAHCPLCGSSMLKDLFPEGTMDPITGEWFHILNCQECRVAFTSPLPADLEPYYPSKYRGYSPLVTSILQWFYARRVNEWHGLRNSPGKALEVGCGAGLMLDALSRKGWSVKGIERTEVMANYAREQLGLDVTSEDLVDLPAKPSYDLIIIFNVLEHLVNPVEILEACAERLNPGGKVVVSVPNFRSFQARFAGPVWLHLDPPRHLFHFTPESLEKILSRVGLKAQFTGYVSMEHDPYGWVESIINRITGRQNALTLFLMGIEPFSPRILLSMVLSVLLAGPALFLSGFSWLAGNGALFQTVAGKQDD